MNGLRGTDDNPAAARFLFLGILVGLLCLSGFMLVMTVMTVSGDDAVQEDDGKKENDCDDLFLIGDCDGIIQPTNTPPPTSTPTPSPTTTTPTTTSTPQPTPCSEALTGPCPTPPQDLTPSFGSITVSNITATQNVTNVSRTLPYATGGDGTLTYSLSGSLPSGMSFNRTTRRLSGTPTTTQSTKSYTYTVTDSDGDTDTRSFSIRVVADTDRQPTFGNKSIPDITATRNVTNVNRTLPTATSGDGTLRYSLSGSLPSGMSFSSSTRRLSGTPTTTQSARSYTYRVRDSDGDTDTLRFRITVNPQDRTPSFAGKSINDIVATKDVSIGDITLPDATGGDGTLTYTLSGPSISGSSGPSTAAFDGPLPDGFSFDSSKRILSGTPTTVQAATTYTYTAQDADGDEATLTFNITVGPPHLDPPTGVTTDKPTLSGIRVSWGSDANATNYKIEVSKDLNNWNTFQSHIVSATKPSPPAKESYTVTLLNHDTTYHFRVRARGDGTNHSSEYGDASPEVPGTTDAFVVEMTYRSYYSESHPYVRNGASFTKTLTGSDPFWRVLEPFDLKVIVTMKSGGAIPSSYEFSLNLDADNTGLQIASDGTCDWKNPVGGTKWFDRTPIINIHAEKTITVVRCGRGSKSNAEIRVLTRPKGTSKQEKVIKTINDFQEAEHQADNQVGYIITGPSDIGSPTYIEGEKPSHLTGIATMGETETRAAIKDAVDRWNNAQSDVNFEAVTSNFDTTIRGYWHPGTGPGEKCGPNALACISGGVGDPHIPHQEFWIKYPPKYRSSLDYYNWTNNINKAKRTDTRFYYLPGTIMHELGHVAGLGHPSDVDPIMGPAILGSPKQSLTIYDVRGMKYLHEGHAVHQEGTP